MVKYITFSDPVSGATRRFGFPDEAIATAVRLAETIILDILTSATGISSTTVRAANTVLAGPAIGADAAPGFRAIVDADLPAEVPLTDENNTFGAGQTFTAFVTVAEVRHTDIQPATITVGSLIARVRIYDPAGDGAGWIPVYDTIT